MSMLLNPYRHGASGDPHLANLAWAFNLEGSDGSTTFTNYANAITWSAFGNAQVDTGNTVNGQPSLLLDGTGDFIGISDYASLTIDASTPFCIEIFAYYTDNTQLYTLLSQWNASAGARSFALQYRGTDATDVLRFTCSTDGSATAFTLDDTFTPTNNTWYYHCIERNASNKVRIYRGQPGGNASMVNSTTSSAAFRNSTAPARIGAIGDSGGNGSSFFSGALIPGRFYNGIAKYDTDGSYPVPTLPFPTS